MKKKFRNCVMMFAVMLLAAMALGTERVDAASQVRINSQNFPDKAIRKVARSYDKNKNGSLSQKEISKIKKVTLASFDHMITNYKGLERFTNLRVLRCRETRVRSMKSKKTITLDLSKNKKLEALYLGDRYYESNITKLKLTNCKKLKTLDVSDAFRLKTMNVKGCAALKDMRVYDSGLTALDVSSCPALKLLLLHECRELSKLKLGNINKLETLDLESCTALEKLDLSKLTRLKELKISNVLLLKLNVRSNVQLETLYLRGAPVSELNLNKQSNLRGVEIHKTGLKQLDLTGTKITKERCVSESGVYYCCVSGKNVTITFADGEKMASPVDSLLRFSGWN